MKIAILTSGILPVPAVQGGAVENLIDFYLEYNDRYRLHDITIYSIWHPNVNQCHALQSKVNHYHFIHIDSLISKIVKTYLRHQHPHDYYHYVVEAFFEQAFWNLRRKKFDAILIENRPGYAVKLKNRTHIPLVCHLHNDFLNCSKDKHNEIYESYSLIISVSNYITQQVKSINPKDVKCKVVYNSIDTNAFLEASPFDRNTKRLCSMDFIIVYSGRLTKDKGILQLIQAIKALSCTISEVKLLIIGASAYGNDKHPTPFIEELQKAAEPIKDKIVFTGFVDYKKIPSYLKMADIAVVPSMWEEPFGLTVIEAMAAGLPLITTRSGGIPEICEGIATIVERNNIVNNLATAILDLYQHPEKRKQMAEASLERSKMFDKETYAKNFFKAIEDELQSPQ